MYARMYVCMYGYMCTSFYLFVHLFILFTCVRLYFCMYVFTKLCLYVSMYQFCRATPAELRASMPASGKTKRDRKPPCYNIDVLEQKTV